MSADQWLNWNDFTTQLQSPGRRWICELCIEWVSLSVFDSRNLTLCLFLATVSTCLSLSTGGLLHLPFTASGAECLKASAFVYGTTVQRTGLSEKPNDHDIVTLDHVLQFTSVSPPISQPETTCTRHSHMLSLRPDHSDCSIVSTHFQCQLSDWIQDRLNSCDFWHCWDPLDGLRLAISNKNSLYYLTSRRARTHSRSVAMKDFYWQDTLRGRCKISNLYCT